jgi:hypothetical protein
MGAAKRRGTKTEREQAAHRGDRVLVCLSHIAGCLQSMKTARCFSRVDVLRQLENGFEATQHAIMQWPEPIHPEWMKERRSEFQRYILSDAVQEYSRNTMLTLSETLCIDILDSEIRNEHERSLIAPILESISFVRKYCDSDGIDWQSMSKSGSMVEELYKILKTETE